MIYLNNQKQAILNHYLSTIDWINSLESLPEEEWRKPISSDKWTVAEVIGHLIPWDKFVLEKRIPYFFQANKLPKSPDIEEMNQQAASESRKCTKNETIHKFIKTRKELMEAIGSLRDEYWNKDLIIGNTRLSLYEYYNGLAEHDIHHFKQVQEAIKIQILD